MTVPLIRETGRRALAGGPWHLLYSPRQMSQERPDRLFRAFADPTRLRLLNLLGAGEACVCDLVSALRLPQPKVSRHLAYLRRAGLVENRRRGVWRHYSLAEPSGPLHSSILSCLTGCLGKTPLLERDARRLKAGVRAGCR